MKPQSLFILLFLFSLMPLFGRSQQYDAALAKRLGADDYGMKKYCFVLLKTGPLVENNKAVRDSLFKGHIANITRLADEGNLIVAGPLGKNPNAYRGIFILNTADTIQAREWVNSDPAVKAGIFETEVFEWYGAAALPEYLNVQKNIEKKGILED